MPKKKPRGKPVRDKTTAQVATMARRADMDVNHLLVKLRDANIKAVGGGPLYANSKIDIDESWRALKAQAEKTRPGEADAIGKLAADAQAVAAGKQPESSLVPYTGDETQPMPSHIREGALSSDIRDFPKIENPDSDKSYRPIHINPTRQAYMVNRGYRFVVDKAHIRRIGHGTLERFVNARGRIQYKDRELAYRPMDLVLAQRDHIRKQFLADRQAVGDAFEANVEENRRRLGKGADAKLQAFEMSEGEAIDRKESAESARQGITRVILDPAKFQKQG